MPSGTYSPYPEIYTPGYGFRTLTGAYIDSFNTDALYPRVWLSSSGKIWTTAQGNQNIYAIDPTGSGAVDVVGSKPVADHLADAGSDVRARQGAARRQ